MTTRMVTQIEWRRIDQGVRDGVPFKLFEGSYR